MRECDGDACEHQLANGDARRRTTRSVRKLREAELNLGYPQRKKHAREEQREGVAVKRPDYTLVLSRMWQCPNFKCR